MTRIVTILAAISLPSIALAGAPSGAAQPMPGDTVRVMFSADCGPCQADLASAQALHDRGVPVMIESTGGSEGFAAARAMKATPAPTVTMVMAPGGGWASEMIRESRAATGSPPTLEEIKASMPQRAADVGAALQGRMEAHEAAMNAIWQG